tara:strand:- start:169 stop:615 length:447 start_codon:yes stop_codon:yes gene_type:complete
MTKLTGYFKMWRGWAKNPALRNNNNYRYLWLYLIESCAFMDTTIDKHGFPVKIKKGDLITSVSRISRDVNMSVQSVRTALKSFENHKMISIKSNKLSTKITLCNYDLFQGVEKKLTNHQQTINKQKKEVKGIKIKKEKEKWWEDGYKC